MHVHYHLVAVVVGSWLWMLFWLSGGQRNERHVTGCLCRRWPLTSHSDFLTRLTSDLPSTFFPTMLSTLRTSAARTVSGSAVRAVGVAPALARGHAGCSGHHSPPPPETSTTTKAEKKELPHRASGTPLNVPTTQGGPSDADAYCASLVQRLDPDAWLQSYFWPRREKAWWLAIRAFNVSTAPAAVAQPTPPALCAQVLSGTSHIPWVKLTTARAAPGVDDSVPARDRRDAVPVLARRARADLGRQPAAAPRCDRAGPGAQVPPDPEVLPEPVD